MPIKILLGFLAIIIAWVVLYRTRFVYQVNAWMRENVFNDRLVLFSGRRLALLLIVLGGISLFSGLRDITSDRPIPPVIYNQMLTKAKEDLGRGQHSRVLKRCKDLVRSDPKNPEVWEIYATAAWASGNKELAKQALDSLLRLNPKHPLRKSDMAQLLKKKESAE